MLELKLNGPALITSPTLGRAWVKSMQYILQHGQRVRDRDVGLLEVCGAVVTIEKVDPTTDFIITTYASSDRIQLMEEKYNSCGIVGDYKISYGKLLYENQGIDQIQWVIERLRRKPESKSATIGLHVPGNEHVACLSLLDFKLRWKTLQMSAFYRSQNCFASQPGNVIALTHIQERVAHEMGVSCGPVTLYIASAHIYNSDLSAAKKVVSGVLEE